MSGFEKITFACRPDVAQIVHYLTRGTQDEHADIRALAQRAASALDACMDCRGVGRLYDLHPTDDGVQLVGTDVVLRGQAIARHLLQCRQAYVFAVTIGMQTDRAIEAAKLTDLAYAYVLDAAASLTVDAACDGVSQQAEQITRAEGLFTTSRFSPGYGDLPLETNGPILRMLGADKVLGIRLSEGNMMMPSKSVTAIIGIAPVPPHAAERCMVCPRRHTCKEKMCHDSQ